MKYSFSIKQIREADQRMIKEGVSALTLMQRAAEALAEFILREMTEMNVSDVLFVCGGGNNGGDGFAAAQLLHEKGIDVAVLCMATHYSAECQVMKERFQGTIYGTPIRRRYALIVDCLFGTGLERAPEELYAILISFINSGGARVIAFDIPSGLSENGYVYSSCVRANATLTIGDLKNALFLNDGADFCGEIHVADIGLKLSDGVEIWEDLDVKKFFPKKKSNVNKGDFGAAALLAPTLEFTGSAFLAAGACLRSGCGYSKLYVPDDVYPSAIGQLPACILKRYIDLDEDILASKSIALGMGAGMSKEIYETICDLLLRYHGILILDADALNALAKYGLKPLQNKACQVILTPHLKEFSRLIRNDTQDIIKNEMDFAMDFAQSYQLTLVLKSNRTIITNGTRTALITTGSPVLAKGGSGDVLTGFLAGTCARGIAPFEAACISSYLLGKAGELAERDLGEYASDATDVIKRLPRAILDL